MRLRFPDFDDTQVELKQFVHLSYFLGLKLAVDLYYFAFIRNTLGQVDSPDIAYTCLFWVFSVFRQELVESIDVSEEIETALGHSFVGEPGSKEAVVEFREEYGVEAVMLYELEVGLIVGVYLRAMFLFYFLLHKLSKIIRHIHY